MFIHSKKLIVYFLISNFILFANHVLADGDVSNQGCQNNRNSLYYEQRYTEAFNNSDFDTLRQLKRERESRQTTKCQQDDTLEPDLSSAPGSASTDSVTPVPLITADPVNTPVPSVHEELSTNENKNTDSANADSASGETSSLMMMEPPPWLTSSPATDSADFPSITPTSEPAVSTPTGPTLSDHDDISKYEKKPTYSEHLQQIRGINNNITPMAEQQADLIDARNKVAIFDYHVTSKQVGSGNTYLIQMVTKKPIADMKTAITFITGKVVGAIPYVSAFSDQIMFVFDKVFDEKSINKSKWMKKEEWEKYRQKLESAKDELKKNITKKLCDNWEKLTPQFDLLYEQEKLIEANKTLNMHNKRGLEEEIIRRSNRVFDGIGSWHEYKKLKQAGITGCPYK